MNFFLGLTVGTTSVVATVCASCGHPWIAVGSGVLCLVALLCETCLAIVGAAE